MSDLLTGGQVAEMLGVSRKTVHVWRTLGKIACREFPGPGGRSVYGYPPTEVDRIKQELRRKRRLAKQPV